jgi:hypothetical protein
VGGLPLLETPVAPAPALTIHEAHIDQAVAVLGDVLAGSSS